MKPTDSHSSTSKKQAGLTGGGMMSFPSDFRVPARVLEVTTSKVTVQAEPQNGCQACAEGRGCGGGVLGKLVQSRRKPIVLDRGRSSWQPGQSVWLVADAQMLQILALVTWGVPVLCLLAVAVAWEFLGGFLLGTCVVVCVVMAYRAPQWASGRLSLNALRLESLLPGQKASCTQT